jgi:hypothetical protein
MVEADHFEFKKKICEMAYAVNGKVHFSPYID